MHNNSEIKTLEEIVSSTNIRRKSHGNQVSVLNKDKVRPSYDFGMSYMDIKPNLIKNKHSFTLDNNIRCLWQPENRFHFLCYDRDPGVKRREEVLYITKGQSIIAKVDFNIYKIADNFNLSVDDFFYVCDSESQESCDFATTLRLVFELEGRVALLSKEEYVEFTLLQVTKKFKGSRLWIVAVNTFINKRFKSLNSIYMLMKAFPVEYTSVITEDFPEKNHKDFEARQKAMLRYYSKVLHSKQITDEVWLYRKLGGAD